MRWLLECREGMVGRQGNMPSEVLSFLGETVDACACHVIVHIPASSSSRRMATPVGWEMASGLLERLPLKRSVGHIHNCDGAEALIAGLHGLVTTECEGYDMDRLQFGFALPGLTPSS